MNETLWPAFQHRTIVIAAGAAGIGFVAGCTAVIAAVCAACLAVLCIFSVFRIAVVLSRSGTAPQARLVGIFGWFLSVFQQGQTRFYLVEFGRGDDILVFIGQDGLDVFL